MFNTGFKRIYKFFVPACCIWICIIGGNINLHAQSDRSEAQVELERLNQRYLYLFNELIDVKDVIEEQNRRISRLSPGTNVQRTEIENLSERLQELEDNQSDSIILAELSNLNQELLLLKNQLNTLSESSQPPTQQNSTLIMMLILLIIVLAFVYFAYQKLSSNLNREYVRNSAVNDEAEQENLTNFNQRENEVNLSHQNRQTDKPPEKPPVNGITYDGNKYDHELSPQNISSKSDEMKSDETSPKKEVDAHLTKGLKDEIALDLLYKEAELLVVKMKKEDTSEQTKEKLEESFNQIFNQIVDIKGRTGVS